jgi:hypothetical protein
VSGLIPEEYRALEMKVTNYKRPMGRPQTRWEDQVKLDLGSRRGVDEHTEREDQGVQSKMEEALFGDPLQWKCLKVE